MELLLHVCLMILNVKGLQTLDPMRNICSVLNKCVVFLLLLSPGPTESTLVWVESNLL